MHACLNTLHAGLFLVLFGADFFKISLEKLFLEYIMGVQRLSGRVLDSTPEGRRFKPQWPHCVVSLSKTH